MHHLADIIVFAIISIALAIKLFSILGQKREREDSMANSSNDSPFHDGLNSATKTMKDVEVKVKDALSPEQQLQLLDRSFDRIKFLNNAKEAFTIILEAYSKGDTQMLARLLNVPMMRKFAYQIAQREEKGLVHEINVLKINDATIANVNIENTIANIKVKFEAEIINYVTDRQNKIISGNKSKIEKINDEWAFSRNLRSFDATWTLVEVDTLINA